MTEDLGTFTDVPGDTPLRDVPPDYDGGGRGRWFVLPEGPDAGRRLYVWERRVGTGPGPVVLLVHGNPECSYTYRRVVAALADRGLPAGTRIIGMDHLGFGRSDQASFEMVDEHHADNLRQLVRALDLHEVTLVVHDWGGPIGIGAFLPFPERVANLVVLNSTIFPMPAEGPTYGNYPIPVLLPWARTAAVVPDRLWGAHAAAVIGLPPAGRLGIVARWMSSFATGLAGRSHRDAAAARVFRQQFASVANARSSKRMVRQTTAWGHGASYDDARMGPQDNRAFYRRLQTEIPAAWGPAGQRIGVAGLFGAWDPLAKPSVLAQWRQALPQVDGHLQVFDGVSHFVEEHRPGEIADVISSLVQASR